jgi:hypothetical protein
VAASAALAATGGFVVFALFWDFAMGFVLWDGPG